MTWDHAYSRLKQLKPGAAIPKPRSGRPYRVKGWFVRDGEEWLAYSVADKSIPVEWIRQSFAQLVTTGELRTRWFRSTFYEGRDRGGCNFTTVGGLFCKVNLAEYAGPGLYVRKAEIP